MGKLSEVQSKWVKDFLVMTGAGAAASDGLAVPAVLKASPKRGEELDDAPLGSKSNAGGLMSDGRVFAKADVANATIHYLAR